MRCEEMYKLQAKINNPRFLEHMALAATVDEQREICEWMGIISKGDESAFRTVLKLLETREENV